MVNFLNEEEIGELYKNLLHSYKGSEFGLHRFLTHWHVLLNHTPGLI